MIVGKCGAFGYLCFIAFSFLLFATPNDALCATYYVSLTGNDTNNGLTKAFSWKTFAHAFGVISPGDTLIIANGTYHEQISPTVSGSSGNPITIRAETVGGVVIDMQTDGPAIYINSTTSKTISHITIEGLIARGHGESAAIRVGSSDSVSESQMTNNIIIRKTGAFGSANLRNSSIFGIGNNTRDSLFEDIWSYGYGRIALIAFGSLRITIRRAVLRHDYWDGSEYKPNDPRISFSGYNTRDSIFENIIALDSAPTPIGRGGDRAGMAAAGNETPAIVSSSRNNKYLGLISLNNIGNGFEADGGSGNTNKEIYFKDIISWDNTGVGFNLQANDDGCNIINSSFGVNGGIGLRIDPYPRDPITNAVIRNCFSYNNTGKGYYYGINQVSQFLNNTGVGNDGNNFEPQYAPTLRYLVKPDQIVSHERGATVTHRYINGVLTNETLWPWPHEDLIKSWMCNPQDLQATHRIAQNGEKWAPGLCESGKTLTRYIWEYLGHPIPDEIYNSNTQNPIKPIPPSSLSIR